MPEKDENAIKSARIEANLTQQKVSDIIGIPKRTLEAWESGSRKPPSYVEKLVVEKIMSIKKES